MLVHLLAKKGYDVLAISSTYLNGKLFKKSFFQKWDKKVFPAQVVRAKTVKIQRIYSPPLILFFPIMIFFQKFDIIHVHGVGTFAAFLGMCIRLLFHNVKLVMNADMNESTFLHIKKSILYQFIMMLPLKLADAVVVYTNREKDFLVKIGINKAKIHHIPMSIRFEELSRINNRVDSNEIVLGFLGKLQQIKGVHRLVESLSRIMNEYSKKVKVIFAGPSEDLHYASSIIPTLKQFPNFKYLGPLPLESVDNFFRMCNIVFVPSLSETCPAVPLEAMAAGKLVIASNISPLDKFIEHGKSGFLIEKDEQFYEYTRMLLDNPNLIQKIGNEARKKVAHHSQKDVICMYEQLYKFLLGTIII
jgi:glycosyltransferase involved in cell wall biosynthesis